MTKTFQVLSVLLSYPSADLQAAAPMLRDALAAENLIVAPMQSRLVRLIDEIAGADLLDAQERYVGLFDQSRSLSLHLFEHVHGESRDRGQAMIDLRGLYEGAGLSIAAAELPDYLPMLLEFLSTRPLEQARELLGQTSHIVAAIAQRLRKRDAGYAAVFDALMDLAAVVPEPAGDLRPEAHGDATDLAALDTEWEEAQVTFAPGAVCGSPRPAGAENTTE